MVRTIEELERAVDTAAAGTTILVADGRYRLRRSLNLAQPGVILRGASGRPERVVIGGEGPTERQVGVALLVAASDVTIADLTAGNVGFHAVQVRGENAADGTALHNLRLRDTGQQIVKGSIGGDRTVRYGGLVACSVLGYTDHAPSNYTNGVDILGGTGWVVRNNRFERVRGRPEEGYVCGPTVLFWQGGRDAQVLDNLLVDCYRGIALGLTDQAPQGVTGLGPGPYTDHAGGLIRGNEVRNAHPWADDSIEVNACPGTVIERNTVRVEGKMPWSISARFRASTGVVIRDNRTARGIFARDGAQIAEEQGNRRVASSQ
jgi:hypothetical protein